MMDDEQLLLSYKSRKSYQSFSLVSSMLEMVDFLICIVMVFVKANILASALANFF